MKFAVTKNDLIDSLKNLTGIIPTTKVTPIDSGVFIKADNDKLKLLTHNNIISLHSIIPANTLDAGTIVVNAKNLLDATNKLGEVINFNLNNSKLEVSSGKTRYSFNTFKPEDFTQSDTFDADTTILIVDVKLADIVNKVAFSCSKDESRPMFTGVLFDIDNDKLTATATNAHRMSLLELHIDNTDLTRQLIIPKLALTTIAKNLSGDVKISFNNTQIAFKYRNYRLVSRLIEGIFPNYRKVAESPLKDFTTEAVIPRQELKDAVDRMHFIADALSEHTIRFTFADGKVNVSADNPDIGSASESVWLTEFNGADVMKFLERCARTCYHSEDAAKEGSADKLIAAVIKSGHESVIEHFSATFKIVCDRGVMAELTRHRLASFSIQSTRYCDYSSEKFDGLTFIKPCFWTKYYNEYDEWLRSMQDAEFSYLELRNLNATPQEARSVLPNSLATEIIMTANLREWRHILKLRTAKDAHPQMREIAIPILRILQDKLPVIFTDIEV